jgi:hypothetical protein
LLQKQPRDRKKGPVKNNPLPPRLDRTRPGIFHIQGKPKVDNYIFNYIFIIKTKLYGLYFCPIQKPFQE